MGIYSPGYRSRLGFSSGVCDDSWVRGAPFGGQHPRAASSPVRSASIGIHWRSDPLRSRIIASKFFRCGRPEPPPGGSHRRLDQPSQRSCTFDGSASRNYPCTSLCLTASCAGSRPSLCSAGLPATTVRRPAGGSRRAARAACTRSTASSARRAPNTRPRRGGPICVRFPEHQDPASGREVLFEKTRSKAEATPARQANLAEFASCIDKREATRAGSSSRMSGFRGY